MKKQLTFATLLLLFFILTVKAQVPYGLNSNITARPTVFLDFDGQIIDDPYWRPFNGDSIISCRPSQLTNASMIKVFNHVSEDFKPFNINITTDSSVYFAAPITRRTRVIITPTWEWYGSVGGVAYIESFRWGLNTPCFVFDTLLRYSDKRVAEAVSHEIGHTLGLYHQARYFNEESDSCRFGAEYHPGRGSGDISWAPIMGNSYDRNLTIWHIGRISSGCSFLQNDLNVIVSTANGITYRIDDYGNTINTGTNINIINGTYSINGLVNDSNDIDYFKFQFNLPGRFIANVKPYNSGPPNIASGFLNGVVSFNGNVDLEVSLFRNNTIISTYNPATRLDVSIDTILEPGNYSIKVNSVSNSNIFKSGMIGSYVLEGSFGGSIVVPIRDIIINGTTINEQHKINWEIISDEVIEKISIEVSNDGRKFKNLKDVTSLNGSFEYEPEENDIYYRIMVTAASNIVKYSKTIFIKKVVKSSYKLLSNISYNNQITINSKHPYEWAIFDLRGKKISNGKSINGQNSISIPNISGMYIIHIMIDNKTYVEKIINL